MFQRSRLLSTVTSQVRSFSVSNTIQQAKIPLVLHGLDGRYATALYSAAVKKQQLDAVESELKRIQQVVEKDTKLRNFLMNPILSRDQKSEGVNMMLSQKYSELTKNFFQLLAENRRLDETMKIIDSFMQLMSAHRGEVNVTVTTAKPLDNKLQNQLKSVLGKSKLVKSSDALRVTSKINPAILGGLVVEIGDKTIDLSISSRLSKLNKLMTDSV